MMAPSRQPGRVTCVILLCTLMITKYSHSYVENNEHEKSPEMANVKGNISKNKSAALETHSYAPLHQ